MPLPKIATPTYSLVLPSLEKEINYRPFLVKEEKLLVLALETEDTKQITTAIKAVLKNCVLTKGIKVESLPTFDIEYLFLNIRGKSVGEQLDVNVICPDDEKTSVKVVIDLDDIKVIKNVEVEFKEISKKLAPDPLNIDRFILNRLLHQIPDLPDNNNFK